MFAISRNADDGLGPLRRQRTAVLPVVRQPHGLRLWCVIFRFKLKRSSACSASGALMLLPKKSKRKSKMSIDPLGRRPQRPQKSQTAGSGSQGSRRIPKIHVSRATKTNSGAELSDLGVGTTAWHPHPGRGMPQPSRKRVEARPCPPQTFWIIDRPKRRDRIMVLRKLGHLAIFLIKIARRRYRHIYPGQHKAPPRPPAVYRIAQVCRRHRRPCGHRGAKLIPCGCTRDGESRRGCPRRVLSSHMMHMLPKFTEL